MSATTHRLLKRASRSEPNPRHNLNTCYSLVLQPGATAWRYSLAQVVITAYITPCPLPTAPTHPRPINFLPLSPLPITPTPPAHHLHLRHLPITPPPHPTPHTHHTTYTHTHTPPAPTVPWTFYRFLDFEDDPKPLPQTGAGCLSTSGAEVHAYIKAYVARFQLDTVIKLQCKLLQIKEANPGGPGGWSGVRMVSRKTWLNE